MTKDELIAEILDMRPRSYSDRARQLLETLEGILPSRSITVRGRPDSRHVDAAITVRFEEPKITLAQLNAIEMATGGEVYVWNRTVFVVLS